jgi:ribose transport system ATP-binding protein
VIVRNPARASPLLDARGVSKRYGSNEVLRNIDFTVDPGEIVSVIGENGAGKSTFAKILAGVTSCDSGTVAIDGVPVSFSSPRDALASGVGFIPQELAFVPTMTIGENVLHNAWPRRGVFTSRAAISRAARVHLEKMEIDLSPDLLMSEIRLAEQQMIEIVKVMARDVTLLILDEPTASLSQAESDRLMGLLRSLAAKGVGIVLISHRFDEVIAISDRVDVFRNAERVFSARPTDLTPGILVAQMLGQAPEQRPERPLADTGALPRLELRGWTHREHPVLDDVSIDVRAGEVLCLFGVRGSGVEVIAEGLTGRRAGIEGRLSIRGIEVPLPRTPRDAIADGIAFLPPDRKRQGLVLEQSIQENMSYLVPAEISKFGFVRGRAMSALARSWISSMKIRSESGAQQVGDLSGGNQQKVFLARRLVTRPGVLVLEEPTRGVDIGARLQIHDELRSTARNDVAVLLITPDVEEAASVSDRVIVMRNGVVAAEFIGSDISQQNILRAAGGEHAN